MTMLTAFLQVLHTVEQLIRLGTPRSLAVEAMESTNKYGRDFLIDRTNHLNVRALLSPHECLWLMLVPQPSRDIAKYYGLSLSLRLLLQGASRKPNGSK